MKGRGNTFQIKANMDFSYLRETKLCRTSCGAMVANDWQQIVSGDLRRALFGQEGLHVEALQGEGHVATDLERIHDFVPKTFQVNAKDLQDKHKTCRWTLCNSRPNLLSKAKKNKQKTYHLWKFQHFAVFHTVSQSAAKKNIKKNKQR